MKTLPSFASWKLSFRGLSRKAVALGSLFALGLGLGAAQTPPSPFPPLAEKTEDGFLVPQPGHVFEFPRDHGRHPGFKVEWWYVTGHLFGNPPGGGEKKRYGFQATFFRRAGFPPQPGVEPSRGAFRSDEIYLFHAALVDTATGKFVHTERLARAGWEASSAVDTLSVQLGVNRFYLDPTQPNLFHLETTIREEAGMKLDLVPQKKLVIFGEDGVSRKGASPDAASWYLTFPRLQVTGTLRLGAGNAGKEQSFPVSGEAWMDHEISSSQLTSEQAGWDWAGIQLEDGREIMVYRLRHKDGGTDPASALFWVERDGRLHRVGAEAFRWEGKGQWTSPRSKASYPLPVRLTTLDPVSGKQEELILEPLVKDQELGGALSGVPYWEGACRVLRNGKVSGSAYVELTGYAGSLDRALR